MKILLVFLMYFLVAIVAGCSDGAVPESEAREAIERFLHRSVFESSATGVIGAARVIDVTILESRKIGDDSILFMTLVTMQRADGAPARTVTGFLATKDGSDWVVRPRPANGEFK
jgi:hypothetical protein